MIYVGIDVASTKHDCFLYRDTGEGFSESFSIDNNANGYKKLHESIQSFVELTLDSNVRIGLESTGHYSNNILQYLVKVGYQVTLINPILTNMTRKSTSVRKTKTDTIDSQVICKFLEENKANFRPYTLLSYHNQALKSLTRQRFSIVKQRSRQKITLQRLITIVFPEYLKFFSDLYGVSSLNILSHYPTPTRLLKARELNLAKLLHGRCSTNASTIKSLASKTVGQPGEYYAFQITKTIQHLNFLTNQIEAYDREIRSIMDEVGQNIMTIPGIGYTLGAIILSEIGDINNFNSADQLLAYAGLDPSVYQSGKYNAKKLTISKRGSKYLRWAIHQASNVIWQHDKTFKDFYQKKSKEGKCHFVILGHIDKKLVRILYKLLRTNSSFIPQN